MPANKPNKSAIEKKQSIFLKDLLLKRSDTFCMIPWVHMHTTPTGQGAPCCIGHSCADNIGVGNSNRSSLADLVNSPKMKKLRLDMIKGTKNPECTNCHKHDDQGIPSFRTQSNKQWAQYFNDVIETTDMNTGRIVNFRMRYFDIRFSNICNFKCRTCGSAFSSKWEQEDLASREQTGLPMYAMELEQGNREEFILEVLKQVPNFEVAYFAGGEPLITEEHYRLLDEMIDKKKTDIQLRYNSNISNLKYKKRDIFKLWQHFDKPIQIYASIDHMGEKAEYIRHGTKWKTIETNLKKLKKSPNIIFQVNTVYSIFNALTISHFYKYMIDNHFYTPQSPVWTLYSMGSPEHLSSHVLPGGYKDQALEQLQLTLKYMEDLGFRKEQLKEIEQVIPWLNSKDTWDDQEKDFKEEIKRIDALRGENFMNTFPELGALYKVPESLRP